MYNSLQKATRVLLRQEMSEINIQINLGQSESGAPLARLGFQF